MFQSTFIHFKNLFMQILKFGGSSIANANLIIHVSGIIAKANEKDRTVVVVSALEGITDQLLKCAETAAAGDETYKESLKEIELRHFEVVKLLMPVARQSQLLSLVKKTVNDMEDICSGIFLLREITPRNLDRMAGFGEWLSSQILAARLAIDGLEPVWKDARELIITDSHYTQAGVDFEATNGRIRDYFKNDPGNLYVIPGYIASNASGVTTTLGRGGSDYTASIIAAATNATVLEIWKDVSGLMTADPRLIPHAKVIHHISYGEAMELSHFGAKVIYPPTLQPVMKKGIPVWIRNTYAPEEYGTLITSSPRKIAAGDADMVRGISSINNITLLSLEGGGMVGIPGFSKRLFEALSQERINVILITQSSSEHSICVAVDSKYAEVAKISVDRTFEAEILTGKLDPLKVEPGHSIIALVGESMKSHSGVSGKMFGALGRNGINVRAIAQGSSEKNISAVISTKDVQKAVNVLHEEFFETTYRQINLFIMGAGNVGSKLLDQLHKQAAVLHEHLRLNINLIGLSNSRKMIFNPKGVKLESWKEELAKGQDAALTGFINEAIASNLRNTIFVDVTANKQVADLYERLLQKSISVVACNKIAASSAFENYKHLKELAREFNCRFLYETNVGAALPVIGTLNDLIRSGDEVTKIEAVLSGTLNFVFNHYDGSRKFADVVRQAQEEGYTEPDPRLDLGGTDVMRKILILAREAGYILEMEDISNKSFMPEACMKGTVAEFYECMAEHESHFRKLLDDATANNAKLKFVATFNNGKATVGLQHIPPEHNFYHLYGKDNIVLFYTRRYADNPLVIKGAGAGADVTAGGVFADIVRAAS
jgi:aspartokinase/homoserine dehydrogenase 1